MHAVIEAGGRQHFVQTGDKLMLEGKQVAVGDELVFDRVLAIDEAIGRPLLAGARVKAKVVALRRGKKLYIAKYRRRKDSRRRIGFRSSLFQVEITEIARS